MTELQEGAVCGIDGYSPSDTGATTQARVVTMLASHEGLAEVNAELVRATRLRVSGVPTVLVDSVALFSGAIRSELMEAQFRRASGYVES